VLFRSSVIGLTTAAATRVLEDDGLVVTAGTAATNAAKDITQFNATSATVAVVYTSTASTAYPVGTKVVISAGTEAGADPVNLPAYALGTWTVTAATSTTITIAGTGFTVADTTGINATDTIVGLAGTIKTQSVAAGANEIEVGDAITITPFAAAS
jgi:predicted metalloprotease with PDZ domain